MRSGDIIQICNDPRKFLVAYVNECRSYCLPLNGAIKEFSDHNGDSHQVTSFGGGISIAPNASVTHINPADLTPQEGARARRLAMETAGTTPTASPAAVQAGTVRPATVKAAAALPKGKGKSLSTKESKAKLKAGLAKLKAKEPKAPRKTATKTVTPCKCGCGQDVTGNFAMGHDARFKGWLLQIERGKATKEKLLSKSVIGQYKWVKRGDGEIPTTNYKGEPHKGYDKS